MNGNGLKQVMALTLMIAFGAMSAATGFGQADADGYGDAARNHYRIEMALDTQKHELTEKLSVTVINDSMDAWDEVCFRDYMPAILADASERTDMPPKYSCGITSVSSDGAELRFATDDDNATIVYVDLSEPLAPGENITLDMKYATDIPYGGMRCNYMDLNFGNEKGDITYELAQCYPIVAIYENGGWVCDEYFTEGECFYSRCADYDVTINVPAGYTVVASGDETLLKSEGERDKWSIAARDMRDITINVGNEYVVTSGESCGVKVNSYYCYANPESKRQGEIQLEAAQDAIKAFTEYYGAYPYVELDVVHSNYEYGGMEAPGFVRISRLYSMCMQEGDPDADEYADRLRGTVAHEVAHEWFYAVVGNDQYTEAWLDESFAAFSEQVYWRYKGRAEADISAAMVELAGFAPSEGGNITVDRAYDEFKYDYVSAVYKRGAAFLYELEQSVGVEYFKKFMHEYYSEYAFKEAGTQDFLAVLSKYTEGNAAARELVKKYLSKAA